MTLSADGPGADLWQSGSSWSPPLDLPKAIRDRLEGVLDAIATAILTEDPLDSGDRDHSLLMGSTGLAVFLHHLAEFRGSERIRRRAMDLLTRAVEGQASVVSDPQLASGFVGLAWAIAHLANAGLMRGDEFDLSEVDDALRHFVHETPMAAFEFLFGFSGLAVYALERAKVTGDATLLTPIVERLLQIAQHDDDGVCWFSDPRFLPSPVSSRYPHGCYNLGLAHGSPGVVAVLGRACADGWCTAASSAALRSAVQWLLRKELPATAGSASLYPPLIAATEPQTESRVAWCYGDLSIAMALAHAAQGLREQEWRQHSIRLSLHSEQRSDVTTRVEDGGFCHGAAGLAHMFRRLACFFDSDVLAGRAAHWYGRILQFQGVESAGGGFKFRDGDNRWVTKTGVLGGSAGIGLVILSALSGREPTWDRMLLCDLAPPMLSRGE